MSFRKTWFSYVLWLLCAGLTGLITYTATVKMLAISPVFAAFIVLAAVGLCILLHFICGKIKAVTVSKWVGRAFHILMFILITAAFILLRFPAVMNLQNVVLSEHASCFYQAAMVGADTAGITIVPSFFEQIYINVLSGLFLLLGNKTEILLYFQILLQSVSFILMIAIGWTLQKRIYAWIPALFYAVSPFFFRAVTDVGPANFWLCITLIGISIICLLEKAWKNRNITYTVLVVAEILFGILIFFIKSGVLLYGKTPFVSGGIVKGAIGILSIEMLVAAVLLILYCVSFWFNKQDHKSLFLVPFIGYCILLVWLSFYEFDVTYFLVMFAAVNLYILSAESMRVIFTFKPEIVTGSILMDKENTLTVNKDMSDFDWSEMKEIMKDKSVEEKTVVVEEEKEAATEETTTVREESSVIDKTAPIENVLPMPKKHKPKVLDYAFEPSEDMMHYDVEIENDDYDY